MIKTLKTNINIGCGEDTCTDFEDGSTCGFLNGDIDGYYCNCFDGERLKTANETLQPLRCAKCKEAEK